MSFYLDRLEAARRQRAMATPAPPRGWPCYQHHQHAALLPRPQHPRLPTPLHAVQGSGPSARGEAAPVSPAHASSVWEEAGGAVGGEVRTKRCLPPKRRAVSACRRFPPGCGRDAAAAGSTALNKAADGATTGGAHHCPAPAGAPSEAPGTNSVSAADGLCNDTGSGGVAGSGESSSLENKDCLVLPSVRLLPKPTMVSAYRRFPPGCQRRSQVSSPVPPDRDEMEIVAPQCNGTESGAAQNERPEEREVSPEVQESPPPPSATLHHEATTASSRQHGASVPAPSAAAAVEILYAASHTSSSSEDEMITWEGEETKSAGSSCNAVSESSMAHGLLPKEHLGSDERVSECATTDTASSSGAAAGVSEEGGAMMRRKVMFTPRKSVKPPKSIQKPALLNTQCRTTFSRETPPGNGRDTTRKWDGIEDSDDVQQDPMSADKCPWDYHYFGPKKKLKVEGQTNVALGSMDDKEEEDSNLEDHEMLNAGKFECGPQDDADARSKVKMICSSFESICRAIVRSVEQRSLKVRRIDLAADKLIRKLPGFTKLGPIVGNVPGVEVGDEFLYRVELALVGLHRPYQGGIDTTRDETGVVIAISVVASGGYPDELSCLGELIYTGCGKKGDGDQKLGRRNLALKNCIGRKTPVRVIHGLKKGQKREGGSSHSHSRAREVSTFTYDGLYHVVGCWKQGRPGSKVFKYKLQRILGQPGLPLLHVH